MDDEYKLRWNNFQDNIASGFQNLYDRGDLVDVTLACDGKQLYAHKIVLAICSPYFQQIFISNPCKHPTIILKDVTFSIMCELLEFMYQGVVTVKKTELETFMKIGELLQIRGLATNSSSSAASTASEKSTSQTQIPEEPSNACGADSSVVSVKNTASITANNVEGAGTVKTASTPNSAAARTHSPPTSPTPLNFVSSLTQPSFKSSSENNFPLHHHFHVHGGAGAKRHAAEYNEAVSIYSRKQRRTTASTLEHANDHSDGGESGMDQMNAEDFFMQSMPHFSMMEPRYDLNSVKREGDHGPGGTGPTLRNPFGPAINLDYNIYKNNSAANTGTEYPNELHMPSDYSKNFGNHMDIPPNGSNLVMLSSTSLLHGNCVFNRNNTVATQQGMKTYWLCKSYRVSMCRARCITHQGRVISATGVHNHVPHMRGGNSNAGSTNPSSSNNASDTPQTSSQSQSQSQSQTDTQNISASTASQSSTHGADATTSSGNMAGSGNSSMAAPLTIPGLRLPPPTSSGASLGGSNMFQHNLHGPHGPTQQHQHQQQQQQQQQHQQQQQQHSHSISPPPSAASMSAHSHHHHFHQSLPNMLVPHHPGMAAGNQTNLHQHSMSSGAIQSQNSVIHNMMHNANLMHLSNMPHMLSNAGNQHSPSLNDHHSHHPHHVGAPHLEMSPLMQSSPGHMQSPSNRSSQSHHGNSIDSPNNSALKSPATTHMGEDVGHRVMGHSTDLSPAEMNSNTAGSTADAASSHSDAAEAVHQARVIDSITISPNTGHNFKIEDM